MTMTKYEIPVTKEMEGIQPSAQISGTVNVGEVLKLNAFQASRGINSPTAVSGTYSDQVATILTAAEVSGSGVNRYAEVVCDMASADDLSASGTLSGSLNIELYKILGVSMLNAPTTDEYLQVGSPTDITNYTFGSDQGGQSIKRVTYRTQGYVWIRYEGAAPTVGKCAIPSIVTNGFVTVGTDAAVQIHLGQILGYWSGSASNRWVLVHLNKGGWV